MRRDLGGEVIAALVALVVIAFALTFGIIISLSNVSSEIVPTPLVAAATPTPFMTMTRIATETITVTASPTMSLTYTATMTPSTPPTQIPSVTNRSMTTGASASLTPSPEATRTSAPTIAPTLTLVPATDTIRASSTRTITASSTITPTATNTFTRTHTPSATATVTPTPTATFTATATLTFTVTFTQTLTPTRTTTFTSTPSPTATQTSTLTPSPTAALASSNAACMRPTGWTEYIARGDEYVADIARAVEIDLSELLDANCFALGDNVRPYTRLYVPRAPTAPIPTPAPPTGTPTLLREGCTPGVQIIAPELGAVVNGIFTLVGTASLPAFAYYDIDIRPISVDTFTRYSRAETAVIGGALAQIDADLFAPGVYWVRLSVYTAHTAREGVAQTCAIPLIFR